MDSSRSEGIWDARAAVTELVRTREKPGAQIYNICAAPPSTVRHDTGKRPNRPPPPLALHDQQEQQRDDRQGRRARPKAVPSVPRGLEARARLRELGVAHGRDVERLDGAVERDVEAHGRALHREQVHAG